MSVEIRLLPAQHPDLAAVRALYESAFPENERRPFNTLLPGPAGRELAALYDGPLFAGFLSLLSRGDITHILYFAVEEGLRGRGLGSAGLEALKRLKSGQRLLADPEAPLPSASNAAQRLRRLAFYRRAGFAPAGIRYRWQGETYELVVCGGPLSQREYLDFWRGFGVRPRTLDP